MKIKDMSPGNKIKDVLLAVQASEVKVAANGKQYLDLKVFDGDQACSAKIWDFSGYAPGVNSVLQIDAVVGEWQGNKQLTIHKMTITDKDVRMFAPQGVDDVDALYESALAMIDTIQHSGIKSITKAIYTDLERLLKYIPGAKSIHHDYVAGALDHMLQVTNDALRIAEGYDVNRDLIVAGAMLHDIGKLFAYDIDGVSIEHTIQGKLLDHIPLGTVLLDRYRELCDLNALRLLQHIVLSHHGNLEWGSPVTPKFAEAIIIHAADNLNAKLTTLAKYEEEAEDDFTKKIFYMNNQEMLTKYAIRAMLAE